MKICLICKTNEVKRKFCSSICAKEGKRLREIEYNILNKEHNKKVQSRYIANNKQKITEYKTQWAKQNTDYISEYNSKYYAEKKEYVSEKYKEWYLKNKDILNKKRKQRIADNQEYYLERRGILNNRAKERYYSDPRERIRRSVSNTFARIATNKPTNTEALLGCSTQEAVQYIESLFLDGMSWDNYGEWHIDHIRPVASIDPKNKEDLQLICDIKNLQPLWANDNLTKSAWYEQINYRGYKKAGQ
jgi:hypothetical protein